MMKRMITSLLMLGMLLALAVPACALEYTFDGEEQSGYGKPTSVETVQTPEAGAQKNEDASKNAALIPPAFGSGSADTLNTGTPLTPNLAPGYQPAAGAAVNGGFAVIFPPEVNGPSDVAAAESVSSGYTAVTDGLYYPNGSLGTLEIPAIGLTVDIFEGTDAATLKRGAGHFPDTSIWDGNCAFAAHNRGANSYFGEIHTLELGDTITLTTRLGTRTYSVTSVSKVSETDRSALAASQSNVITLYTCVRDQRELRWCVTGQEIV